MMILKIPNKLLWLFILLSFSITQKSFSQCFDIESILVDACSPNNPSNDEGLNEMVRFKVGPTSINMVVTPLSVTWPNGANSWLGWIQNGTTATRVSSLNSDIIAAGGCGQILEPTNGVLPANATVILVTSQNFSTTFNSFGSLSGTIYMIFQNNLTQTGGNFANYNVSPGTRTLSMSFGGACTDVVTYERSLLINVNGTYGGTTAQNDGSTVNFSPSGTPSYINNGCNAPIPPFTVNAGSTVTACKGSTINLLGTAQGQDFVLWSAPTGTFSNASNLSTSYTIDPNATGSSIIITLTATKINGTCTQTKTSTITVNFTSVATPNVTTPVNYCQNVTTASALSASSSGGGTLNWYGTNVSGGTASSTAPIPSTSTTGTTTYYVSQTIGGCESNRVPIVVTIANTGPSLNLYCDTASLNTTPTSMNFNFSNVGQTDFTYSYSIAGGPIVTGTWIAPSNYTVTGMTPGQSVTFTVTANGVSCISPMTVTCNTTCPTSTTPTFNTIGPICIGATAASLPLTSTNSISGTWSPATISTTTAGTQTYTFTPNSILFPCATTTTLNVNIVAPTIPTFTALGSYCENSTPGLLQTNSTNGYTGTWSPTTISTTTVGTQTYNFTPTTGQCATTTSMSITIIALTAPTFTSLGSYCQNTTPGSLPTTSNNGIIGTWSPANISTAIIGTQTYNFTPTTGQCATTTSMSITIIAPTVPTFTSLGSYCQNTTPGSLPTTSNNGITGTWSPATISTAIIGTQTYNFTPITGQCATTTSMSITIIAPTVPTFISLGSYCQNTTPGSLPTTSNNGIIGTWSPATISTSTVGTQTYNFTPSLGQCATSASMSITIIAPTVPTFTALGSYCQNTTPGSLPTTSNNGIIGTWSPATISTAIIGTQTYNFTPSVGQCATSASMSITIIAPTVPTFVALGSYCQNSIPGILSTNSNNGITGIWSPTTISTSTIGTQTYTFTPTISQCATTTIMNIVVTTPTIATFTALGPFCQNSNALTLPTTSTNGIIGTWSPSTISTATIGMQTYNFTPTAGQCGLPTSIQISIIQAPTITQPTNYVVCDDNNDGVSCLFDLHTKDVSISTQPGIQITYHYTQTDAQTGSNAIVQNPYCNINSVNTQTLYVRVFDPLAPACSSYTTLQLVVTPKPVAHLPNDYHLCDDDTDGIAIFNLTSVVTPQILGTTLSPATHMVTYYESLADAQAPTSAIVVPSAYASASQTIWVRVDNTTTGCYDIVTVNLVVDSLPLKLAFYPQYELCETVAPLGIEIFDLNTRLTAILLGQTGVGVTFYPSLLDATNNTNVITTPSAYTNTQAYAQTLGIRLTNTATGCYVISTMDLVVNPKPQPKPQTKPYTVCDTDQDGVAGFDLNTLTPAILMGAPAVYDISYYLTQTDATTPQNPINTANLFYNNNNSFVQFLFVRAEDPTTHCFTIMQVELRVDPAPVAPLSLPLLANCDTDTNPQDGCTTFNLSAQTPAVLALQPLAGTNYTVTYYTSQASATTSPNGTAPIINTTSYIACGAVTKIWVRVQNKTTGCYAVGSFDVQVNTPVVLTTPTLLSVCDNDSASNNLYTTFNMSGFIGIVPGHTLQFFLDANHTLPILTPGAFVNTVPATQTVFIVATNTLTGCKSYRTLTVVVLPVPTPRTNLSGLPLVSCDITSPNDGYEIFDLTTNAAYIMNGDANVTLHYYPTKADAIANTNEIVTGSPIGIPTAANVNQNVWIRVESNYFINTNNEHCYVLVEQPIKVNPLPLVKINYVYQECDDDTDGFTAFHLNTQSADMLQANAAIALADCTFAFYEDAALTIAINPTTYTNLTNPQTIYVVVTHTPTGCKSPATAITLVVNPKPIIIVPANFATCDTDAINDGYFAYPLDVLIPNIIGTQPVTVPVATYSVTFYNSQSEANSATAALTNIANYQTYSHIIWIRIENDLTHCYRTSSFETIVEQQPEPEVYTDNDVHVLCVSYNSANHVLDQIQRALNLKLKNNTIPYLDLDNNPATYPVPTYTYQWYVDGVLIPGATNDNYNVPIIASGATRQFTVEMLSLSNCLPVKSANFEVIQSGQAVAIGSGYTVTNAFSENQIITVNVEGWGAPTYQYSLDDGPRQVNPIFENVSLGEHTITIWDTKGGIASSCDPLVLTEVQTIDYPHYFTPNGDGINDYWNIVGLQNDLNAKIYIFDRQGKLIKQISPQSKGWDGTYNGNLMISTDYWFTVDYNEAPALKQFKAHFSLKR